MEHGEITSVYYENGVVSCDVRSLRINTSYDKVPVLKPHSGFSGMPKQGNKVIMDSLADGKRFITHIMATESAVPGAMKEGEITIQLDEDTTLSFKETGSGYTVTISASDELVIESQDRISITAEDKIEMTAPNGIFLNGTKFSEHIHDYDDDGTTETTTPPN